MPSVSIYLTCRRERKVKKRTLQGNNPGPDKFKRQIAKKNYTDELPGWVRGVKWKRFANQEINLNTRTHNATVF